MSAKLFALPIALGLMGMIASATAAPAGLTNAVTTLKVELAESTPVESVSYRRRYGGYYHFERPAPRVYSFYYGPPRHHYRPYAFHYRPFAFHYRPYAFHRSFRHW